MQSVENLLKCLPILGYICVILCEIQPIVNAGRIADVGKHSRGKIEFHIIRIVSLFSRRNDEIFLVIIENQFSQIVSLVTVHLHEVIFQNPTHDIQKRYRKINFFKFVPESRIRILHRIVVFQFGRVFGSPMVETLRTF